MRPWMLVLSMSLFGCGSSVLRPLVPTDAASGLEQVTRSKEDERRPAISPDAKALAYEVNGSHVAVMSLVQPGRLIYASKAGREPAWMPDASSIVYTRRGHIVQTFGQGERAVFNADVGDPYFGASQPAVSPDGHFVAISVADVNAKGQPFDRAIGVTDLLGTGTKILTTGSEPTFSPDGKLIAFTRQTDGRSHVFIANADGSNATQVTDGTSDDHTPTFSPDGKSIAFCSVLRDDAQADQANLFVVRTDGTGLVQLTEGDRYACSPAWGRDGFIYFEANARQRFHIWRIRPSGAVARGGVP
jgi:Tol biopolymer transport system component